MTSRRGIGLPLTHLLMRRKHLRSGSAAQCRQDIRTPNKEGFDNRGGASGAQREMMCFSVQKLRKRFNGADQAATIEESTAVSVEVDEGASSPPAPGPFLSARRSFRSRVRAIQNAQRFIYCNPKMRSSHPSYGSRDSSTKNSPDCALPFLPLGGSARSTSELGSSLFDAAAAYHSQNTDQTSASAPSPQPLPSPRPAPQLLNAYRLPLPSESANTTSLHPSPPRLLSSRINTHTQNITVLPSSSATSNLSALQPSLHVPTASALTTPLIHVYNGINPALPSIITSPINASISVVPSIQTHNLIIPTVCAKGSEQDLQPLPPPKVPATASALRCFNYDELASACQNFSSDRCFDDADACFYGAIKVKVNETVNKHQDVVVVRSKETPHQGLQAWISELLMIAHELHERPHVCKLVGFYGEDGCLEPMLVYEKLRKGSLCTILFERSDAPPLDWSVRTKIAYGVAQGLASVHETHPDKVLYKDFRASSIQVDDDYSSKISGYRLINTMRPEIQTSRNNPRVHAYRAPETVSRGELTQKSNVWSFGVILLELLSGKQNMDERITGDERDNLVKWAKPFLLNEGKHFLLMDPKLQGRWPLRGVKMVADLVLLCLNRDPLKRPTMREALDKLKTVHELSYTTRPSTKELTSSHKVSATPSIILPSSSDFGVKRPEQALSYHRLPPKFDIVKSPPLRPLLIPPRCSEDVVHDYPPAPLAHVKF